MGADDRMLVSMSDEARARKLLEPILADSESCGDEEDDAELVHVLADQFAESRRQSDDRVERLRELLSEARIRLDQHIGMCACPGMACVEACSECHTTQDLVNRIRAFMQGRSA
jgi:hypothetical protein